MPSSACETGRLAGRAARARAGSSRERTEHLVGVLPDRGLRTLHRGVGAACTRKEMPACRTGPSTRVVDHHRHAVVDHLLVLERLVRVPDRRDRDLVGPELVEQVLALHPPDRVADHVVERLRTRSGSIRGRARRCRGSPTRRCGPCPDRRRSASSAPTGRRRTRRCSGRGSKPISNHGSTRCSASCHSCVVNASTPGTARSRPTARGR